jgi:hypothetical protein
MLFAAASSTATCLARAHSPGSAQIISPTKISMFKHPAQPAEQPQHITYDLPLRADLHRCLFFRHWRTAAATTHAIRQLRYK